MIKKLLIFLQRREYNKFIRQGMKCYPDREVRALVFISHGYALLDMLNFEEGISLSSIKVSPHPEDGLIIEEMSNGNDDEEEVYE